MLPTISPFDENLVLTHCDMTGAYISYNGGTDWRMFNLLTVPVDLSSILKVGILYMSPPVVTRTAKTGDLA
jgi:hypothetical protein